MRGSHALDATEVADREPHTHRDSSRARRCPARRRRRATRFSRSVAWRSDDGGFLWRHIAFPGEPLHQRMYASGDPQVAFTRQGTALFVTMSLHPPAKRGRGIDVFRSADGGATWDTASFVFGDY